MLLPSIFALQSGQGRYWTSNLFPTYARCEFFALTWINVRLHPIVSNHAAAGCGISSMEESMNLKSLIPIGRARESPWARTYDPFTTLQREVERVFEDFSRGWPTFSRGWPTLGTGTTELTPKMDATETEKEFELTFELPGLEEKDVEVNVADNVLTIRGEKKAEKEQKDKNYRVIERSYGSFARSVELPDGIDPAAVKATITKGVLKVTVPKPAPAVTKKVEIKAAA
jgi:HSP20 family protein